MRFNHSTEEGRREWNEWMNERIKKSIDLERRFEALWGSSREGANAREARELLLDDELKAIPGRHRLIVARRLVMLLQDHDLFEYERDDLYEHLRAVAAQMGIPYVELFLAEHAFCSNPDTHRDDLNDWLEWCRENAPERLEPTPAPMTKANSKRRAAKAVS